MMEQQQQRVQAAPPDDDDGHDANENSSRGRLIRSEVHLGAGVDEGQLQSSVYRFRLSPSPALDADGDVVVPRRRRRRTRPRRDTTHQDDRDEELHGDEIDDEDEDDDDGALTVRLQHRTATTLQGVGQQLWRGALLLAEAVLARREALRGRVVLELGAGTGLVSIVAALAAEEPAAVYLTDMDDEGVLSLARANVAANGCGRQGGEGKGKGVVVTVAALDWEREQEQAAGPAATPGEWGETVHARMGQPDVILAADVIYDDQLTDAFFKVLRRLLWAPRRGPATAASAAPLPSSSPPPPSPFCLLALERRPVFSTAHLRVVAHGYDRFREQLALTETPWPLEGRLLPLESVPVAWLPAGAGSGGLGKQGRWGGGGRSDDSGGGGGGGGGGDDDLLLELWEIRARRSDA